MVRTQIQLTADQARTLKRLAAVRGVSMAALIRQAVERLLEAREPEHERALAAVGAFGSGAANVIEEHDRCLADGGA